MLREFAQRHGETTDQKLVFSAQRVVSDQARIESSPLVSYMLEQANVQFRQVVRLKNRCRRTRTLPAWLSGMQTCSLDELIWFAKYRTATNATE